MALLGVLVFLAILCLCSNVNAFGLWKGADPHSIELCDNLKTAIGELSSIAYHRDLDLLNFKILSLRYQALEVCKEDFAVFFWKKIPQSMKDAADELAEDLDNFELEWMTSQEFEPEWPTPFEVVCCNVLAFVAWILVKFTLTVAVCTARFVWRLLKNCFVFVVWLVSSLVGFILKLIVWILKFIWSLFKIVFAFVIWMIYRFVYGLIWIIARLLLSVCRNFMAGVRCLQRLFISKKNISPDVPDSLAESDEFPEDQSALSQSQTLKTLSADDDECKNLSETTNGKSRVCVTLKNVFHRGTVKIPVSMEFEEKRAETGNPSKAEFRTKRVTLKNIFAKPQELVNGSQKQELEKKKAEEELSSDIEMKSSQKDEFNSNIVRELRPSNQRRVTLKNIFNRSQKQELEEKKEELSLDMEMKSSQKDEFSSNIVRSSTENVAAADSCKNIVPLEEEIEDEKSIEIKSTEQDDGILIEYDDLKEKFRDMKFISKSKMRISLSHTVLKQTDYLRKADSQRLKRIQRCRVSLSNFEVSFKLFGHNLHKYYLMAKELRLLKDVYSVRLFGNRIIVSFSKLKAAERAFTAGQIQAGIFSLRVISRSIEETARLDTIVEADEEDEEYVIV